MDDDRQGANGRSHGAHGHPGPAGHQQDADQGLSGEEWAEMLARTVAHLAAQLTVTQIRLRALATELAERGVVDDATVLDRVRQIAVSEAGDYLHANLGEPLADLIDVPALERDLIDSLS